LSLPWTKILLRPDYCDAGQSRQTGGRLHKPGSQPPAEWDCPLGPGQPAVAGRHSPPRQLGQPGVAFSFDPTGGRCVLLV